MTNRCFLRVTQSYPESFRVALELPRVTQSRPKVKDMNEKKNEKQMDGRIDGPTDRPADGHTLL